MRAKTLIRGKGRRGNAIVEVTLLMPWILFLFLAIFNFGFYAYALISVENAARVAAMYTSSSPALVNDAQFACQVVLEELRSLPGIGAGALCAASGNPRNAGASGQITVFVQQLTGAQSPDGAAASEVAVTYRPDNLFPLPFLMGNKPFTRVVRMRILQ